MILNKMLAPSLETIVWKFVGPSKLAVIIGEATLIAKNVTEFLACGPRYDYGGESHMDYVWDGVNKLFFGAPEFRFHYHTERGRRRLTRSEYGRVCFLNSFTYRAHAPCDLPDVPALTLEKTIITVKDVERWVEHCEGIGRFLPENNWFDEPDTSHIFFEGIKKQTDGSWSAFWGS